MSRKYNKHNAYSWVAYMVTHHPEEMAKFRKYGTPSDKLIRRSERPIYMTTADGKKKLITFPVSLNTNRGQKALHEVLTRFDTHLKSIPIKMHNLFQYVKTTVLHRRSDTQSNMHMVAEAIIHRAACEFKTEVIFAFDSINAWVKTVYGKELGYNTLRKAIELLEEAGILKVVEWGVKGNRHRATKIKLIPVLKRLVTEYTSEINDWLMSRDMGMMAVYNRESVTRGNVVEKAIQHYADLLMRQEAKTSWLDMHLDVNNVAAMFEIPCDTIVPVQPTTVEEDNDYFNRLLGELVPALQEADAYSRQAGRGVSRQSRFGQSRSRSPGECAVT